jgi:hypothetical protein
MYYENTIIAASAKATRVAIENHFQKFEPLKSTPRVMAVNPKANIGAVRNGTIGLASLKSTPLAVKTYKIKGVKSKNAAPSKPLAAEIFFILFNLRLQRYVNFLNYKNYCVNKKKKGRRNAR